MPRKDESKDFSGIAGAIGGTTIGMIAVIVIWASYAAWIIIPVVGFMTLLGISLGYMQYKSIIYEEKTKRRR
ncbi:MAG: hypothetical protein ACLFTR_01640 [Candidatus Woesearchaeota archaeon]